VSFITWRTTGVLNRSSDPNLFEIAQTESQLSQIVSVEADWQFPSAPERIGGLLYQGRRLVRHREARN
jgi:hypothetical protein